MKFKVMVDWGKCEGSEICVNVCPTFVFEIREIIVEGKVRKVSYVVNEDECIGCFGCTITCPNDAITVVPRDFGKVKKIKQTTLA